MMAQQDLDQHLLHSTLLSLLQYIYICLLGLFTEIRSSKITLTLTFGGCWGAKVKAFLLLPSTPCIRKMGDVRRYKKTVNNLIKELNSSMVYECAVVSVWDLGFYYSGMADSVAGFILLPLSKLVMGTVRFPRTSH